MDWVSASSSSLDPTSAVVYGTTVLAALLVAKSIWGSKSPGKPIPGPPRLPLIGNALDMPMDQEWLAYEKWKRKYGDIVALDVLGQQVVVLNTPEYIHELMEKRAATSSGRMHFNMCGKLVGFKKTTVFLPPDAEWRETRALMRQTVGPKGVKSHIWLIEAEFTKLLGRILNTNGGQRLMNEIRHAVGAVTIGITYGLPVPHYADPLIGDVELAMAHFSKTTRAGAYYVDVFPSLEYVPSWFPGAGFKREAATMRADMDRAVNNPFNAAMDVINNTKIKSAFVHDHMSHSDLTPEKADTIKWSAISLYLAGSDTASGVIHVFFLAMAMFQEVQARAREEIHRVVGRSRLPTLHDRPSLPYMDALLRESLKASLFLFFSPLPRSMQGRMITSKFLLAAPHMTTADEMINGYFIKAHTLLLSNSWSILHDEKYFSNPEEFVPERFLGDEGKARGATAELDPLNYVFGHGRRACPGQELAEREVWMAMASVLSSLKVMKPLDADGNERDVPAIFLSGSISHAAPFECRIRPFDDLAEKMIQAAIAGMETESV
ncbi:hypothetical protein FRC17_000728 [Serendipita sp. 399]|nr:hypothetical protein FRC17_000728 [Serendipita sp. 399]